jgi:DNA-binding MarR family transcriptional regulator
VPYSPSTHLCQPDMRVYTRTMTECYCTLLRTAARKATSLYDDALAPLGINIAQFSLLRRIARHAPISLTELGKLCELDRSTVGRNTKLLERMGLVKTVPSRDQREATLMLTEQGNGVLRDGAALWEQAQVAIEAALGIDAQRLKALLQTL